MKNGLPLISANPKFYRLNFRASHRVSGSSWAEPVFVMNLPNNWFSGNVNKVIKIVADFVHIWVDTASSTPDYSTIEIRLKNVAASNMYETTGAGVYSGDTCLCRIHNDTVDDTNKRTSYVLEESRQNAGQVGFITRASLFNQNQIQFQLKLNNGSAPVAPSSTYLDYNICLGIYVDFEEGYEHSHSGYYNDKP